MVLVLWLVSLVGVGKWQNEAGRTAERVSWQAREVTELQTANAEIERLNKAARADEQRRTLALSTLADDYEKEKANAKLQRDKDIAAAQSGALSLRFHTTSQDAGCGGLPGAPASASGGDAGKTTELPRAVTANLYGLVDDADEVVRQLAKCQSVVKVDRATSGR